MWNKDRQCTYTCIITLRHARANIVAVKKQSILHIMRAALGIQHAVHMRHFVIYTCPAVQYFFFDVIS
jgi:hypothetical protein